MPKRIGFTIMDTDIEKLRNAMYVQLQSVDFDPYMAGMYNGMEFMLSSIEKREPIYFQKDNIHPKLKNKLIAIAVRSKLSESDELQPHY